MKLENFAHSVALKVFEELEHAHHFVVPKNIQQAVIEKLKEQIDELIS